MFFPAHDLHKHTDFQLGFQSWKMRGRRGWGQDCAVSGLDTDSAEMQNRKGIVLLSASVQHE